MGLDERAQRASGRNAMSVNPSITQPGAHGQGISSDCLGPLKAQKRGHWPASASASEGILMRTMCLDAGSLQMPLQSTEGGRERER